MHTQHAHRMHDSTTVAHTQPVVCGAVRCVWQRHMAVEWMEPPVGARPRALDQAGSSHALTANAPWPATNPAKALSYVEEWTGKKGGGVKMQHCWFLLAVTRACMQRATSPNNSGVAGRCDMLHGGRSHSCPMTDWQQRTSKHANRLHFEIWHICRQRAGACVAMRLRERGTAPACVHVHALAPNGSGGCTPIRHAAGPCCCCWQHHSKALGRPVHSSRSLLSLN